jgi:polysaccharide export outer membrane protein
MRPWWAVGCPMKISVLFLALFAAAAQTPNIRPQAPNLSDVGANLPSQSIGPDDLIALFVYDSPEFSRTVRVGPDGTIRLPMLKQKIKASGLLPGDLEITIAKALVDEKLLVDPFVTVTMSEYHSRPISVVGAVKNPITFQAVGPMTLIDALSRAGGLSDEAEGELLVSQAGSGKDSALVRRVSIRELIDKADPEANLKLTGGEEVLVPSAPRITVAGNVKKPGSYPLKENSEMTVMKAIAMAEGTVQFSGSKAYIYRVDDPTGKKNEIEVPLADILKRKAQDVPLVAKDILYIPDSSGKRNLDRALGIAAATASGVLIFH